MRKLAISSVYDLDLNEKLKLLVLLCNQMLMLNVIRDHMEDANDKLVFNFFIFKLTFDNFHLVILFLLFFVVF